MAALKTHKKTLGAISTTSMMVLRVTVRDLTCPADEVVCVSCSRRTWVVTEGVMPIPPLKLNLKEKLMGCDEAVYEKPKVVLGVCICNH